MQLNTNNMQRKKNSYLTSALIIIIVVLVSCCFDSNAQVVMPGFQAAEYVPNSISTDYITQVTTNPGNNNTATAGGTISNSLLTSTQVGIIWSLNPVPDYTVDPFSAAASVTNTFTANLSNLKKGSTYYVSSYAVDNNGRLYYGNPIMTVISNTADGNLNYTSYASPIQTYANDLNQLNTLLAGGAFLSSGVAAASALINWTNGNTLTAVGVVLTANKDDFAFFTEGFFIPLETGTYNFSCEGDDADDLYINGLPLITQYGAHGASVVGTHTATISLTAGVKYTFRARMQERAGQEVLQVFWRKPSAPTGPWIQDFAEISSF